MKVPKTTPRRKPKAQKKTVRKPPSSRPSPRPPAERRTLLPVLRPYFNGREVIKQLAMLEDHLNNQTKRCTDCIHKHFLTSEGLAEELGSLCTDPRNRECGDLPGKIRVMHHAWAQDPKNEALILTVAQELRLIRKALMRRYATLPLDKLPSDETAQVKALVARCRRGGGQQTCKKKTGALMKKK